MVSAEAMATVRRVTVMDRDAETDLDTTEATVHRVTVMDRDVETDRDTTVTDRDVVEIVRDIIEATVRRMVDVTAVEDRAQEVVQGRQMNRSFDTPVETKRKTEDTITVIIRSRKSSTKMRISAS